MKIGFKVNKWHFVAASLPYRLLLEYKEKYEKKVAEEMKNEKITIGQLQAKYGE